MPVRNTLGMSDITQPVTVDRGGSSPAANINIAIPTPWTATAFGWSGTASIDRYGNWYWSPLGLGFGKSATFVSGSLTGNWLDKCCPPSAGGATDVAAASSKAPTPQQLNSFLTRHGYSAAAGFWGGVTKSYTPGSGFATGVGFVSPQIGGSYNYSFQGRGNTGLRW